MIREGMKEITELSGKLAVHFCENEQNFKLEEFLCIMKCFCDKVQHCQKVSNLTWPSYLADYSD